MSFYADDLKKDLILSVYLDRLYERLEMRCERVADLALQHRGVDLKLAAHGSIVMVDEKAQMHYLNQSLKTFAFEIGYLKNGIPHMGWLFDEQKITEVYFLIVHIYTDGQPLISAEQIKSCRILRIDRQKLLKELAKEGLDKENCLKHELKARASHISGKISIAEQLHFSFFISKHLKEQPFNLLIGLKKLGDLGEWIC